MSRQRRLLDEVRDLMRLHHYSIHTERSYCDWIKRYVHFHAMSTREDLHEGEAKIEAFLTHLAVQGKVAPSTQNQAMNALVFLYKRVLRQPLDQEINAVRASRKPKMPVVMTREEVAQLIAFMEGTPQLVVKLLYGSGLRIMEAAHRHRSPPSRRPERPHQSLGQKTPDVVYRAAIGGGAVIVDKLCGGVEETPVPLRSTGISSTAEARPKTTAKTKTKAKLGQRRPAASEVECAA
jgi:hypothetical protein